MKCFCSLPLRSQSQWKRQALNRVMFALKAEINTPALVAMRQHNGVRTIMRSALTTVHHAYMAIDAYQDIAILAASPIVVSTMAIILLAMSGMN